MGVKGVAEGARPAQAQVSPTGYLLAPGAGRTYASTCPGHLANPAVEMAA